jgi:Flp pilus assembly protein TadD
MMQSEDSSCGPTPGSGRREQVSPVSRRYLPALLLSLSLITSSRAQGTSNAIASLDKAIEKNPTNAWLYDRRGWAYGSGGDLDKAIADFTQAIRLNPRDAVAYGLRGKAYSDKGDLNTAIGDLNESIRLKPNDALTRNNRGYVLTKRGRLDLALQDLNEAVRLDPRSALAYANRGYTYSRRGEFQKALDDFNEAIRLDPKDGRAYNSLAWLLATCPDASFRDGQKAIGAAKKACELVDWKLWYFVGTLAAAYAEAGEFPEAVSRQKQALGMKGMNERERAEAEAHLGLYEQRKPYHEPPRR